jgi:membrane protein required for colicin V production
MSLFDIIAGLLLIVSAIVGLRRGATHEVTTVLAFVAAAVIAVFGLRFTGAVARHMVATPWMANVAALLVSFVAAYIILRLIAGMLTRGVQATVLSGPDRVLGGGIGVARGLIAIGACLLLIDAAVPPQRLPVWITGARLYPVADASASLLRVFAPQGWKLAGDAAPGVANEILGGPGTTPDSPGDDGPAVRPIHDSSHHDPGYSEQQRKALDVLVEKSR